MKILEYFTLCLMNIKYMKVALVQHVEFMYVCVCVCLRFNMPRSWWPKRSGPEAFSTVREPPQSHGIHVYLFWTKEGPRYLSHTNGEVTAEELCISAAKAVGETDSLDQILPHKSKFETFLFCSVSFFSVFFLFFFSLVLFGYV